MKVVPDSYGHCVKCHRNLLQEAVIDGKIQERLSPDYSETEYMIDDGSRMKVAICKKCKVDLKDTKEEKQYIIDCVIEGWKKEINDTKWDKEKKDKNIERYSKKKIVCKSEGLTNEILTKKLSDYVTILKKETKNGVSNKK